MSDLKIENIAIGEIHPYAKNAKNHPEKQIQQTAESIKHYGFNNPLILDENNEVIAGHGRLDAAKVIGLDTVPVIRLSHLTEVQKRAYRLADNKIASNGGWNEGLLRLEISELETICDDLDISITGFDDIEIDVLMNPEQKDADPKVNNVPYISESEIVSKVGDIWNIGEHRIICGNALDDLVFEKLMQGKLADLIESDPPWNIPARAIGGNGKIKHADFKMAAGEMSESEFTQFLIDNFKLCSKYSTKRALCYHWIDFRHISEIMSAGKQAYDSLINLCVWTKHNAGLGSFYRSQHELCFVFCNGKESHVNNVELGRHGRYRSNVWSYPGVGGFGKNKNDLKYHPTVKNFSMIKDLILDASSRGDLVLDTFLGSGTTLIAAHQAKRICYGIELEPLYIDTAIRRFKELFGIDAIRESDGKTYTELLAEKLSNQEVA